MMMHCYWLLTDHDTYILLPDSADPSYRMCRKVVEEKKPNKKLRQNHKKKNEKKKAHTKESIEFVKSSTDEAKFHLK